LFEAFGLNDPATDGAVVVGTDEELMIGVDEEFVVDADGELVNDALREVEAATDVDIDVEVGIKGAGVELCIEVVATEVV